jgi:hypothetical protein
MHNRGFRLSRLLAEIGGGQPVRQVVGWLYDDRFAPDRPKAACQYLAKASDSRTDHGGILWVLLNSSEFALNTNN